MPWRCGEISHTVGMTMPMATTPLTDRLLLTGLLCSDLI